MSSVHYNLSYFLMNMEYNSLDFYNGYKNLMDVNPTGSDSSVVKINYDKNLLILSMKSIINDFISSLTNTLECLKLDISSKLNNISSLDKILTEKKYSSNNFQKNKIFKI